MTEINLVAGIVGFLFVITFWRELLKLVKTIIFAGIVLAVFYIVYIIGVVIWSNLLVIMK